MVGGERSVHAAASLQLDVQHAIARRLALEAACGACVETLLGELSPPAIEWWARKARWQGPFWPRTVWREYTRRHRRFAALFSTIPETVLPRSALAPTGAAQPPSLPPQATPEQDLPQHPRDEETLTQWPFVGFEWNRAAAATGAP